ncbi:MAG TPA: DUF423 domain-containing protein [Candidatus Acidoferrum sp.]|nr:DUF423 domain-containing protein [Candidatus Acidoferrum sp.]
MDRIFFTIGACLGALGVMAGAFGAHFLQGSLATGMPSVFATGVLYQLIHALALLMVAWATTRWHTKLIVFAGWLFLSGTVLFSGSLYLLSLTGVQAFGLLTPLGGLAFIVGWLSLAYGVRQAKVC